MEQLLLPPLMQAQRSQPPEEAARVRREPGNEEALASGYFPSQEGEEKGAQI